MKKMFFLIGVSFSLSLMASEQNGSTAPVDQAQLQKHVEEQMKREEQFARTQAFVQGDDYNLSEHQIDPNDLENVPVMEPEYDLNMDDAYD